MKKSLLSIILCFCFMLTACGKSDFETKYEFLEFPTIQIEKTTINESTLENIIENLQSTNASEKDCVIWTYAPKTQSFVDVECLSKVVYSLNNELEVFTQNQTYSIEYEYFEELKQTDIYKENGNQIEVDTTIESISNLDEEPTIYKETTPLDIEIDVENLFPQYNYMLVEELENKNSNISYNGIVKIENENYYDITFKTNMYDEYIIGGTFSNYFEDTSEYHFYISQNTNEIEYIIFNTKDLDNKDFTILIKYINKEKAA